MKWALIAIVAVVVLGGVGYAVYELTSLPEDAQEWWDEQKLENFPTQAAREIKDMEDRLAKLKDTRQELDLERIKLQGGESMGDSNFKEVDTGFMTRYGYDKKIEMYIAAGEKLGASYKDTASSPDALINADTGELSDKATMVVSFTNPMDGKQIREKELTVADVMNILGQIEEKLVTYEYERELVNEAITGYEETIKEIDTTIKAQEQALKEFRQEVKKIEAQLKIIKVKEDLAEINKAISGKESNSELGKLIAQYEKKKKDFAARQMQDAGTVENKPKGLEDLSKESVSAPKSSRFIK